MARQGALRWVRALTLASVVLASGLSGHVAAGGGAPTTGLLGPMLIVLTLAASPFLDAPASSRRVVALVLAAQAAIHVVLGLPLHPAATHASMTMPAATARQAGGAHLSMVAAHVAAALVVSLWLAAGERALWALAGVVALAVAEAWLAVRYLTSLAPAIVATVRRPAAAARTGRSLVRRSVWQGGGGLSRRGPPYSCAAA